MSRRGARLAVAVLFAFVCGAAAWQYARVERRMASGADAASTFEREARTLATAVADLRGAQQAYVAAGQGIDFWTARVTRQIGSIRARLDLLRREATSVETGARLDAALTSLDDFARMDARVREYAVADQRLLASDLIFGDGFEMSQAIASEIEAARAAEAAALSGASLRFRREQRLLAAGIAALGFLFLVILALAPGAPARANRIEDQVASAPAGMLDLALARPPVAEPHKGQPAPVSLPERKPHTPPTLSAAAPVNLSAAALLCADLARVTDSDEIPGLLERIANVLDAKGIVLWIADPDGRELIPTTAHGYPAAALARLGTIPHDADNATAAAFREQQVHTVKGDRLASGAIVAPLVTAGGCAGVMAAEVRHEREQREEVRAVTSMLAAQLGTLIGVAPVAQTRAKAN